MTSILDLKFKTEVLKTKNLETTLTRDLNVVNRWITQTLKKTEAKKSYPRPIIGEDTEWRKQGEVAVLQLFFKSRVLVYQIIRWKYIPFYLIEFLNDETIMFTGVKTKEDFLKLSRYGFARGVKNNKEHFLSEIKDLQDEPRMKNKSLTLCSQVKF
jgi:hypothetical protein